MKTPISELLSISLRPDYEDLYSYGTQIGKLYTEYGLPVDIALGKVTADYEQKLCILSGICNWFVDHKRRSGATENALQRQRALNKKMVQDFIDTGETGIY